MITRRKVIAYGLVAPIIPACRGFGLVALRNKPMVQEEDLEQEPSRGLPLHTFGFKDGQFMLDKKPFVMTAGELHPARIPVEYWEHRIQMVKAMGFNTVSAYLFWNYFETKQGEFDFVTENRNLEGFIQLCHKHGMWIYLRPGPYVNAFWDLGGIPAYLLQYDDIKLRNSSDVRYMASVESYISKLSSIIKPHLVHNGGPILMVQVENEYGSFHGQGINVDRGDYSIDPRHVEDLRQLWVKHGLTSVFSTNNGESQLADHPSCGLPEQPIGFDPLEVGDLLALRAKYPSVPVFSSETYSGWDALAGGKLKDAMENAGQIAGVIDAYLSRGVSFSMYVAHGGSNFGPGGSTDAGNFRFQPIGASYDYLAPINEQGRVRDTFYAIRDVVDRANGKELPIIPVQPLRIELPASQVKVRPFASIWDGNLPRAVVTNSIPLPCEHKDVGRFHGCGVLYRTTVRSTGTAKNILVIDRVADIATVFVNGQYRGSIDHSAFNKESSVARSLDLMVLPSGECVLDIFVYTFGHSSWKSMLDDRKGIIGSVTLNNTSLDTWDIYPLPMDSEYLSSLKTLTTNANAKPGKEPRMFFEFTFEIEQRGETYIDVSQWTIGAAWINGRRLGNYYCSAEKGARIGPQFALNCPGVWLRRGVNRGVIFDLFATQARDISLLKLDNVYDWKG
ncbi:MAG: beta-galactosidase [Edaphobacter sp.]|uniref:beta-galactosidase n=1 Tax=Edaphobacter sp. TaxID=1934404 RepID=UPI0029813AE0|nr:beta-galactosidase [Edaphobacter sp.]MDW5267722.1 beta-galactosidase [Edaphobacter sp.]